MLSMLAGRFHRLKEYYSNEELLKCYLYMIDFVHNYKDIILRFYHNPYDYNVSALGYLSSSHNAVIILLRENTPIKSDHKIVLNIMKSQHGFIEIFRLSTHEFDIDREILLNNFQIQGMKPEEYILEYKIDLLRDEVMESLGQSDTIVKETITNKTPRLVYNHEASTQLEDVTYRASILLRKDYHLIETDFNDLPRMIDKIFSEKNNVVLIIKLGSMSIWMIKQSNNRIGLRIFPEPSEYNLKIETLKEIKNIMNEIVSRHKGGSRRARIFVYDLNN